jgi:hypothetical protein
VLGDAIDKQIRDLVLAQVPLRERPVILPQPLPKLRHRVCGLARNASRFWRPGVLPLRARRVLLHMMAGLQGPRAASRAIARELAVGVDADYSRKYDSAVACFMNDFEACIAHLRFPVTHRRAIRTTNLLERPLCRGTPSSQDHPESLVPDAFRTVERGRDSVRSIPSRYEPYVSLSCGCVQKRRMGGLVRLIK